MLRSVRVRLTPRDQLAARLRVMVRNVRRLTAQHAPRVRVQVRTPDALPPRCVNGSTTRRKRLHHATHGPRSLPWCAADSDHHGGSARGTRGQNTGDGVCEAWWSPPRQGPKWRQGGQGLALTCRPPYAGADKSGITAGKVAMKWQRYGVSTPPRARLDRAHDQEDGHTPGTRV